MNDPSTLCLNEISSKKCLPSEQPSSLIHSYDSDSLRCALKNDIDTLYYTTYNIVENDIICRIVLYGWNGGVLMSFQLGSSLLDACVLAVLVKEDTYGYSLTQQVREVMDISESTLYPVLRRLQKKEFLTTYDQPFQGRNRRYYRITASGIERYEELNKEWVEFKHKIDSVLMGGKQSE